MNITTMPKTLVYHTSMFCKFCLKDFYMFFCLLTTYEIWICVMAFYGFKILIDLDDDFLENVKVFVSYILSRDMLIPKRIHNKTVTGEDLVKYIKVIS